MYIYYANILCVIDFLGDTPYRKFPPLNTKVLLYRSLQSLLLPTYLLQPTLKLIDSLNLQFQYVDDERRGSGPPSTERVAERLWPEVKLVSAMIISIKLFYQGLEDWKSSAYSTNHTLRNLLSTDPQDTIEKDQQRAQLVTQDWRQWLQHIEIQQARKKRNHQIALRQALSSNSDPQSTLPTDDTLSFTQIIQPQDQSQDLTSQIVRARLGTGPIGFDLRSYKNLPHFIPVTPRLRTSPMDEWIRYHDLYTLEDPGKFKGAGPQGSQNIGAFKDILSSLINTIELLAQSNRTEEVTGKSEMRERFMDDDLPEEVKPQMNDLGRHESQERYTHSIMRAPSTEPRRRSNRAQNGRSASQAFGQLRKSSSSLRHVRSSASPPLHDRHFSNSLRKKGPSDSADNDDYPDKSIDDDIYNLKSKSRYIVYNGKETRGSYHAPYAVILCLFAQEISADQTYLQQCVNLIEGKLRIINPTEGKITRKLEVKMEPKTCKRN